MKRSLCLKWIGIVLIVTGTILAFSWNGIFEYILIKEMSLSPNSKLYKMWRKLPVPAIMNVYMFNCTNPNQLMEENYMPEVVQLGPYRFNEFLEKVNITWNQNHTVTYRQIRRWYFDAENSNGSLSDNVTTLNVLPVAASFVSRYWSDMLVYPISTALSMVEKTIWITKPVSELLFDGYTDPILTIAITMPSLSSLHLPADKIGFFYGRNGSAKFDGVFNMETGTEDISKLGTLRHWNYRNRTDYYEGDCGEVRGFTGEVFPPGQTRTNAVEMFSPDLCRYVSFEYSEDAEVNGVTGYRYVMSKKHMDNGTTDPDTWCNCGGECLRQGVLNVSSCRHGAPGFVSYPHFLDADPYYLGHISGLEPEPHRHRSYVTLEPRTGIPLDVAGRLQLNLLLQPSTRISLFRDVPTVLLPVMWFEKRAAMTPDLAASLRMLLRLPDIGFYCFVGLLLLGLVILGFTIIRSKLRHHHPTHINRKPCSETAEVQDLLNKTTLNISRL